MTGTLTRTVQHAVHAVRTADGAQLHATVDGPDDAPVTVVLAHGWTLAQAAWDDVADLLATEVVAGEVRLVRYDQRGHGRSTWGSTDPVSIDLLGDDLAAVLAALVPTGPVVLGGHSMGGMTIMALAAAHPELIGDRVRGVALVDTSAGELSHPPRTALERLQERLLPAVGTWAVAHARRVEGWRRLVPPSHPRHRAIVRGILYGTDATDAMVARGAEIMAGSSVRSFVAFYPALGAHDKAQALAELGTVPVEILVGDADKLTPVKHSGRLAEAIPTAHLQIVPGCGHMLPQERPDLVAAAIRRLLPSS
ncbi:Pimeloyl-ACP methyl ester carboxylesterase [Klenkia soli]|uniref:Pimeloyl-ACP methyl ester carboxylesterase n=1 Tax=Klenkia soli TaxID=1052260 RepID=A0A1H0MFT9_9ACTN|nr:alpha/beta hydrolase [Klenkia soli]SDO79000.1 Pimeloyl-ACP methyl ester carboxylesterase [Klenkia soli]